MTLCRWHYQEPSSPYVFPGQELVFVCIGTDRCIGDSLGPLVGRYLKEHGVPNVYGCLDDLIHAENLDNWLEEIKNAHPDACIIAVDACLGKAKNIGYLSLKQGPLKPGSGVNKELTPVGDYHLIGVVNVGGFMEHYILQNTRLSLVDAMAVSLTDFILDSLTCPFPEGAMMQAVAVTEEFA